MAFHNILLCGHGLRSPRRVRSVECGHPVQMRIALRQGNTPPHFVTRFNLLFDVYPGSGRSSQSRKLSHFSRAERGETRGEQSAPSTYARQQKTGMARLSKGLRRALVTPAALWK